MLDKNCFYYENAETHEITTDTWLAEQWALVYHVAVVFWRWSDVCETWLDVMVREP